MPTRRDAASPWFIRAEPPPMETHTPVATASRLAFGSGDMSRCVMPTRRDAASPWFIRLASPPKETHTPVATASRLAFGSGDMSRCVMPTRRDAASPWFIRVEPPPKETHRPGASRRRGGTPHLLGSSDRHRAPRRRTVPVRHADAAGRRISLVHPTGIAPQGDAPSRCVTPTRRDAASPWFIREESP